MVKLVGMVMGLAISIYLGRILGPDDFGVFNLANRILTILVTICLLGVPRALVKEIAIADNKGNFKRAAKFINTSYILNGAVAIVIVSLMLALSRWIVNDIFEEPKLYIPLILGLLAVIPKVYSLLFSSGLVGFRKIWQSNLVDNALIFFIIGASLAILWFFDVTTNLNTVALVYSSSALIIAIIFGVYWKSVYKYQSKFFFAGKELLKTSLPLFYITVATIISANIDGIILGAFVGTKEVGLYAVALRLAMLNSFILVVMNGTVAPKVAALYASDKIQELDLMINRTNILLTVLAALNLLIFIFVGRFILSFWGSEFTVAYPILMILSVAQFINITTGNAGTLLIMCGKEKLHSFVSIVAVILNIVLNVLLIKIYGIYGAAIATGMVVIFENVFKLYLAKKHLGILTLPRINLK